MSKIAFMPTDLHAPVRLPVMAIREVCVFPHAIVPLFVGRPQSIKAIKKVNAQANPENKLLCLALQKDPALEDADKLEQFYETSVVARVNQIIRLPDGTFKVIFEGLYRVSMSDFEIGKDFPTAMVTQLQECCEDEQSLEVAGRLLKEGISGYAKNSSRKVKQDMLSQLLLIDDAGHLADATANLLPADYTKKQEVLSILDVAKRLEELCVLIGGETDTAVLERRIKARIREQSEKNQRDFYLNEQLRAIHKELGHDDDPLEDLRNLEELLAKRGNLPAEVKERVSSELKKLRFMTPVASEYTIVRGYIEWILALPWNDLNEHEIDITEAKKILDADHFGLEKPKERILEYLAVQKLSKGIKGPILCLVGPPGVGKTSLAKSIARATGKEFVRLSLGGVRDEAEIRGHRRTYIGALPGKIIQSFRRVKSNNPLFCLDEVDKLTSDDFRGDPASALLEVLDPEQNYAFVDHYLDLDYDLSKVFFVMTANDPKGIPDPLLDRMEIIELNSYLETEKLHIAKDFLVPKQIQENGLTPQLVKITDNSIMAMIRSYTSEAGVRSLERSIAKVCRKVAVKYLEEGAPEGKTYSITRQKLPALLGPEINIHDEKEDSAKIGVCAGLAWTAQGGEILFIEANIMSGSGAITSTGKLGDVMKESATAAMSYVRSNSARFGLKPDFFKGIDVHVHVPAGATPKDGPSAGITIVTSITSAILGIPVKNDVAMTGEISLRGRVLPIGGLREKLLGAKRAGIANIVIPKENEKDLKEVPEEVLKGLSIIPVEHMDEVLPLALAATKEEIFSGSSIEPLYKTLRAAEADKGAKPLVTQ